MTRRPVVLTWIERSLFAAGAVLAAWCAVTIIEAHYFNSLAVPEAGSRSARRMLPGESPDGSRPRSPLAAGTWIARLEAPSVSLAALGLCCLATIYPAFLASRMRPVEGLRYE